jgi:dipeptidyl-peptidase-4
MATICAVLSAQTRLRDLPTFERYQRIGREIPTAVRQGRVDATWLDANTVDFTRNGDRFRYDISARSETRLGPVELLRPSALGPPTAGTPVVAPNGQLQAAIVNRNVVVSDRTGANSRTITSDASAAARIANGAPSDLYRQELQQQNGLWWSPTSTKLAFYRVDERRVPDYPPVAGQPADPTVIARPYPTPQSEGAAVDVLVYDIASGRTLTLDVRDGRPASNDVPGYYVFSVSWAPDGQSVLLFRANRRQNVLELCACRTDTGRCRTVVSETATGGWVDLHPEFTLLSDGHRFVWSSERSGFRNLYLYDLSGKLHATLTQQRFDVDTVFHVSEQSAAVFYTSHDGNTPFALQLHQVRLDGSADRRLTDPAFHHTVTVAPDGRHFVDVEETHDRPPTTSLRTTDGQVVQRLASSDTINFERVGLKPVELFTYPAADGVTTLHGLLHRPSTFDPSRKYPLLVSAYAAPGTNSVPETFALPSRLTELGFLVASLESRGEAGRGRAFKDAVYQQLGHVEVDDQAAGVRSLLSRPYVDRERIGIFGTSYGGYTSIMAVLRHPELFAAASSSSAVTDWRNYNALYAERHLGLLTDNSAYARASALSLAGTLARPLLLFYGTADDNVHPLHSLQLADAIRRAGRTVDVQTGPAVGHASVDEERMMEFFTSAFSLR